MGVISVLTMLFQAVIDLLIPGQSPGIKEQLIDLYGKPEILFFGPDGKIVVYLRWSSVLTNHNRGYG